MTKFAAHSLISCVPISRTELFEDVTKGVAELHGAADKVWVYPGHVFVSLEGGQKLLTFDCKPVSQQQVTGYDNKTLDLPALKTPVLDVFVTSGQGNTASFIVQQNGHVQCWQFLPSFQWTALAEFDLCTIQGSEVTSVCLHEDHNCLYWCESVPGENSAYRICSAALPEEIGQIQKEVPVSQVIVESCPSCEIFPLGNGLLIVPRCCTGQVRVCLFWRHSVMELVSIATIIGNNIKDHYDMRSPVAFSQVLCMCLPEISQCESTESAADYGAKKDLVSGNVYILHTDGLVKTFLLADSEGGDKQPISVKTTELSIPDQLLETESGYDIWNVHRNIIAIATNSNTVRLYDAAEGCLIHDFTIEIGTSLLSLAVLRSPAFLVAMVTSAGVKLIQGGKKSMKSSKVQEHVLPTDRHFQTDALKIALLAQQRDEKPSQEVLDQLAQLCSQWQEAQAHQPQSNLSDIVDTYLAEFWRLEEQASRLGKSQPTPPQSSAFSTAEMVRETVARCRSMTTEAAMSELIWLSQKYPTEVLETLLGGLDVEKVDLTLDDHRLWQSILGFDTADNVTFELICRLLYQEKPNTLVPFVRNAQFVSEQAVGVSAFLRKKHKLLYYVRAMECLPEPNNSQLPKDAALAKAQIILVGAAERGAELALRFLLRHREWSEAIQLLKQLGTDSPQHTSLFFLLFQHLIQAQTLSDYASEVFSLLPSWKSFVPAFKVMSDSTASQIAVPSSGLFCTQSPDIPLSAVRSHLMSLLSQSESTKQ